jgi:O-acetyl-ADP-ribose deacetylase (regulator of RNase III)
MTSDRVQVVRGDITRLAVDAIVNAANESLLGGGGVDGAIHAAAGPELVAACLAIDQVRSGVRCPTGEARVTRGFNLPAHYVIHTVGPVWRGGQAGEDDLLRSCYRSVFQIAHKHAMTSLAFPAISCGIFGYPVDRASAIAVDEVRRHLATATTVMSVTLVAFDGRTFDAMRAAVGDSPDIGDTDPSTR